MSICYAILVDAGFVKRKLGTRENPMDADAFEAFINRVSIHPDLIGLRLHRVYVYDAAPLSEKVEKPLGGGEMNFATQPIAQRGRKLHADLQKKRNVAIRMGELAFRGWTVKPGAFEADGEEITIRAADLRPNIQQKAVDMRIGLDIAALTLKKIAQVIVLVTGDSDFIPAMKFARREGARLYLVPIGHAIKESMYEHADLILDIAPRD
ncbi:NYN domain-containing protein [Burkholderia ambifaria]|uniref:NYN domain-containing protein n=1 Tax=Burkholderia ambifaria TaxID=152480 RepID=UPI003C7DB6F4